MIKMNMELFRLINNLANQNKIIDGVMICFSKYVPIAFIAAVVIVFLKGIIKNNQVGRQAAVNSIILTLINLVISGIIGSVYYVDRPFVHNKVNLLFPHMQDASFPSDHATGTMSIARSLGRYNKALSLVLTLLSVAVGFSRVFVGHHYPADVASAYLIVFVTSWIYNIKLRAKVSNLYSFIEGKITAKLRPSNLSVR